MTLHRFFVPPDDVRGDAFPIPPSIERQVRTVLRLGDGDRIALLDGGGSEIVCRLSDGRCEVEERREVMSEPSHRLTVVQALLKGDALEEVIRHGTEVGAAAFRLVVSERCVAREISPRKLERLRTIAREAAEQSERGVVPPVEEPIQLAEALEPGSVLLYERHDGPGLSVLEPPTAVIVGPEGGFTPGEIAAALAAGVVVAGLGRRILRSETVAVAAGAVILSRAGDFA